MQNISTITDLIKQGKVPKSQRDSLKTALLQRKIGILKAIEDYRQTHLVEFFEPNSKIQAEFYGSLAREGWLFGGERSGKTTPSIVRDINIALGRHKLCELGLIPVPNNGQICSEDSEHIIEVIQQMMLKYLPQDRIVEISNAAKSTSRKKYLIRADNGKISKIVEKSYESGWRKYQGRELNWVHCDEQPPYLVYKELIERLASTKGYFWCSMTPTATLESGGDLWVYREIVQAKQSEPERFEDIWLGYISKWDNKKYLSEEEIARLEEKYGKDSRDAKVRIYGLWDVWMTRVYDNWHDGYPYVVPDNTFDKVGLKTWYMGIDPHPRIPFALMWLYAFPREDNPLCRDCKWRTECQIKTHWCVADEHFGKEEAEARFTTSDYAKLIKIKNVGRRIYTVMIDPYANGNERGTNSTIRREFARLDVPTRCWESGRDAKSNRIELVRGKFQLCEGGLPRVFILEKNKKTRWQIGNYEFDNWKVDDKTKEVKQQTKKVNDHLPDCLAGIMEKSPAWVDEKIQQIEYEEVYSGF